MGNPLGLSSSVTQGIVSATGRTVTEGRRGRPGATIPDMVQTSRRSTRATAAARWSNLDDQVIGIPTLAATDPQIGSGAAPGIGFAIPSSTVKRIADQIVRNGKVTDSGRAALGVTVRGVARRGLRPAGRRSSPPGRRRRRRRGAARRRRHHPRRLHPDHHGPEPLTEALAALRARGRVKVTYVRDGGTKTVEVTLGALQGRADG